MRFANQRICSSLLDRRTCPPCPKWMWSSVRTQSPNNCGTTIQYLGQCQRDRSKSSNFSFLRRQVWTQWSPCRGLPTSLSGCACKRPVSPLPGLGSSTSSLATSPSNSPLTLSHLSTSSSVLPSSLRCPTRSALGTTRSRLPLSQRPKSRSRSGTMRTANGCWE